MTCAARIMCVSACCSLAGRAPMSAAMSVGANLRDLSARRSSSVPLARDRAVRRADGRWRRIRASASRQATCSERSDQGNGHDPCVSCGRDKSLRLNEPLNGSPDDVCNAGGLGAQPANRRFPHVVNGHIEQQVWLHGRHQPRRTRQLLVELARRPSRVADQHAAPAGRATSAACAESTRAPPTGTPRP